MVAAGPSGRGDVRILGGESSSGNSGGGGKEARIRSVGVAVRQRVCQNTDIVAGLAPVAGETEHKMGAALVRGSAVTMLASAEVEGGHRQDLGN